MHRALSERPMHTHGGSERARRAAAIAHDFRTTAEAEKISIHRALVPPVVMAVAVCLLMPVVLPLVLTQAMAASLLAAYFLLASAVCLLAALCLQITSDTAVANHSPRLRNYLLGLLGGYLGGFVLLGLALALRLAG